MYGNSYKATIIFFCRRSLRPVGKTSKCNCKTLIQWYDYDVKSLKMIQKLITRKLFSIKSLQVFGYVMHEISNK